MIERLRLMIARNSIAKILVVGASVASCKGDLAEERKMCDDPSQESGLLCSIKGLVTSDMTVNLYHRVVLRVTNRGKDIPNVNYLECNFHGDTDPTDSPKEEPTLDVSVRNYVGHPLPFDPVRNCDLSRRSDQESQRSDPASPVFIRTSLNEDMATATYVLFDGTDGIESDQGQMACVNDEREHPSSVDCATLD